MKALAGVGQQARRFWGRRAAESGLESEMTINMLQGWACGAKLTVQTYLQQAYNRLDSKQPTEKIQITYHQRFFPIDMW
jgi:hypothetical protein